ncbi:MAG: protein kinase, partial [Acidobacteriota bacterium]
MVGKTLGHYEILEPLGAGGMGEVYLGQDTRLGRKVAIKVLPAEFASDPERLARFEQEAQAAAALNHPHIAVVHDIGSEASEDGSDIHYMVQELLEGESLRERLERGALPLEKALGFSGEVAEALVAAHAAGIVHRDLKPDNIFVTEAGHAKVLDFGLAKLTEVSATAGSSASMSPTMLGTVAGQIMGTAGYMAPEQVNGGAVDGRADLFAFGCVLYEVVTGRRAFAGENIHDTLSKIISREPLPLHEVSAELPFKLGWIVDKALAKDPARRYQSAADLAVDLQRLQEDVLTGTADRGATGPAADDRGKAAPGLRIAAAAPLVAGAALIAALATWWLTSTTAGPTPIVQRFAFDITPADAFTNVSNRTVTVSPDGSMIVFVGSAGDDGSLWLRPIGGLEVTRLPNTAEPRDPTFSPDSTELAFWSEPDTQIKRMPLSGGSPVRVDTLPERPYGMSWGDDGYLYVGRGPQGIWRVAATGGVLEQVVEVGDGESAFGPRLLPDGDRLTFTLRLAGGTWDEGHIVAHSLASGDDRVIFEGGRDALIVPSGHLVYVSENTLLARAIDLETLEVTGGPVAMADGIGTSGGDVTGTAFYDVSASGTLVRGGGIVSPRGLTRLAWIDREGNVEALPHEPGPFGELRLSPDERRVAAVSLDPDHARVVLFDLDRPGGQPLVDLPEATFAPVWSPDGDWVYFSRRISEGDFDVYRRRSNFSGAAEAVFEGAGDQRPLDVSSDGEWLLFMTNAGGTDDIARVRIEGTEAPELVVARDGGDDREGRFSPDGRFVAYTQRSQSPRVYVREIDSGAEYVVSPGASSRPVWARDGSE